MINRWKKYSGDNLEYDIVFWLLFSGRLIAVFMSLFVVIVLILSSVSDMLLSLLLV